MKHLLQEEPKAVLVDMPGKPVRLGVAWRPDAGEPGTVVVTRVTAGSPAQLAGLQLKDRIYEIGGRQFADSDELLHLAKSLPSPMPMLIEREGRLQEVTLDLDDDPFGEDLETDLLFVVPDEIP